MRRTRALVCIIMCFLISGCNTIGPRSISNGRSDYNRALVKSDQEQILLNLVRLRYHDTPQFIEVSGFTAAYELITNSSLTGTLGATGEPGPLVGGIGVTIKEKPTITYTPLQGENFITQMLSPISGEKLVLLAQSTRDVDTVMRLALQVVGTEKNVVPNAPTAAGPRPKDPPEFKKFLTLSNALNEMQRSGCIQFVWTPAKEAKTSEVKDELKPKDANKTSQEFGFSLDKRTVTSTRETKRARGGQIDILLRGKWDKTPCSEQLTEVYDLLGIEIEGKEKDATIKIQLDPESYTADLSKFNFNEAIGDAIEDAIKAAGGKDDKAEVKNKLQNRLHDAETREKAVFKAAIKTVDEKEDWATIKKEVQPIFWEGRSVYSILMYLSHAVNIPEEENIDPNSSANGNWRSELLGDLLRITTSDTHRAPDNASVAVRYRGHWFYIDDGDYRSKDTFGMLSRMIALQAGDIKSQAPVQTISVN